MHRAVCHRRLCQQQPSPQTSLAQDPMDPGIANEQVNASSLFHYVIHSRLDVFSIRDIQLQGIDALKLQVLQVSNIPGGRKDSESGSTVGIRASGMQRARKGLPSPELQPVIRDTFIVHRASFSMRTTSRQGVC